jgi:uncharacterized protein (DUF2252 family)
MTGAAAPEGEPMEAPAAMDTRRKPLGDAAERMAAGRTLRQVVPRTSHAGWAPAPDRPDPVALLAAQAADRLPELVPIRHGRMLASPFGFLRGAAVVMAHDLATTPDTGIQTQLCGDAHLLNFGVYATPERNLVFDLNDFDETLPGPWEWDLKRLAASVAVAGRGQGFPADERRAAVASMVGAYAARMRQFAGEPHLSVWYSRLDVGGLLDLLHGTRRRRMARAVERARRHDNLQAQAKLTVVEDGQRRIREDPPLLTRVPEGPLRASIHAILRAYRVTLPHHVDHLLGNYRFVDVANKVVGVGSVGTRCFVALLEGTSQGDPLFLQVKQAERSVLAPLLRPSRYRNQGQRVVQGQRLMQAASDQFLGWIRVEGGRDFYWRQLRDMKGSADVGEMDAGGLLLYAKACGAALARAHARAGDPATLSGYLGATGGPLPEAVAGFAEAYADQAEIDHAALGAAVKAGRVRAVTA